MVMDEHRNGIPVAWYLHEGQTQQDFEQFFAAIKAKMHEQDPTWCPSCFLVDADAAQIGAIE